MGGELPLPSLFISGFRGFPNLSIPQLGRVTLLTGRNGVGKTTVLDTIRIYAAATCDTPWPLVALLAERLGQQDEWRDSLDEDGNKLLVADYTGLFHGRGFSPGQPISIGPDSDENNIKLEIYQEGKLSKEEEERLMLPLSRIEDTGIPPLMVIFKEHLKYLLPQTSSQEYMRFLRRRYLLRTMDDDQSTGRFNCEFIGPRLPDDESLVEFIDKVALTKEAHRPIQALELILGHKVYGIVAVGRSERRSRPRVMVKLSEQEPRVPLKSLGDGVTRFFGIAAALLKSRNGILLIDEVENGIHYTVHEKLWKMILEAAHEHNIQVVATTHSRDTIIGCAKAIRNSEIENTHSALVRIEGKGEDAQAVEYSEEEIKIASQHNIEMR
ncbi:MAG: AAA family ATPase [Synechococcus sp. SB0668_bin_15]|nr:AAA family ATPase [Synechococcus sp. SB0668_bin_15]MYC50372.1 AAA family ATPase [Synechococcus sp. SB0662_bin_14]